MASFRGAKKFNDGDIFIIYAAKGTDKFEIVNTLCESLANEDGKDE